MPNHKMLIITADNQCLLIIENKCINERSCTFECEKLLFCNKIYNCNVVLLIFTIRSKCAIWGDSNRIDKKLSLNLCGILQGKWRVAISLKSVNCHLPIHTCCKDCIFRRDNLVIIVLINHIKAF